MVLEDEEPEAGPWRAIPLEALAQRVLDAAGPAGPRPRIVAVDGRSASGKTTLAGRLGQVIAGSAVVHTDDIAWWHSALDWSELMIDGVLAPVRRGEAVRLRPPAWEARGRPGAVEVPASARGSGPAWSCRARPTVRTIPTALRQGVGVLSSRAARGPVRVNGVG